jgi:glycerol-3-phosphate acyltransferase PlsX
MSIIVDAMGGDRAPEAVVAGAVDASRELGLDITLTGADEVVRALLTRYQAPAGIKVVHAPQTVGMGEAPTEAFKQKPDSSLSVGLRLLKQGEGEAFVSAGNSGAVMAGALLILGRLEGVQRPALGAVFAAPAGRVMIIDAGANVDNHAEHLLQFAQMGAIYMERVVGVAQPRIGLLSNGRAGQRNALVKRGSRALSRVRASVCRQRRRTPSGRRCRRCGGNGWFHRQRGHQGDGGNGQ